MGGGKGQAQFAINALVAKKWGAAALIVGVALPCASFGYAATHTHTRT